MFSGSREGVVQPITDAAGKAIYKFMPNEVGYWDIVCENSASTTASETWGFCWSVEFRPGSAGHNHVPSGSLSYLDPQTGKLLPNTICRNGMQVGSPSRVDFKAPAYSSLVIDKVEYSGACSGTLTDEDHITVTKNSVIQLQELVSESYLNLKQPLDIHPKSYFGTADTNSKIRQIAKEYNTFYPKDAILTLTDMSLPWGAVSRSMALAGRTDSCINSIAMGAKWT